MRVTPRAASWLVASMAFLVVLGACGGGGDEGEIQGVVKSYLGAITEHDPAKFASYVSATCHLDTAQLQSAFASVQGQQISIDVQQVNVSDLTDTSPTATVEGSATFQGRTVPLSVAGGQYQTFKLVKENDAWRIATCPDTSATAPAG
jgi:predicted alpha-1,6-mannanase (GH76 family)